MGEILEVAEAPVENLMEQRFMPPLFFWYLSGTRVGAFVTLTINAIDIKDRTVIQFPELGVRTKYRKHAVTHVLNLPELLRIVHERDSFFRGVLKESGYKFAPIPPISGD